MKKYIFIFILIFAIGYFFYFGSISPSLDRRVIDVLKNSTAPDVEYVQYWIEKPVPELEQLSKKLETKENIYNFIKNSENNAYIEKPTLLFKMWDYIGATDNVSIIFSVKFDNSLKPKLNYSDHDFSDFQPIVYQKHIFLEDDVFVYDISDKNASINRWKKEDYHKLHKQDLISFEVNYSELKHRSFLLPSTKLV